MTKKTGKKMREVSNSEKTLFQKNWKTPAMKCISFEELTAHINAAARSGLCGYYGR